MYAYIYTQTHKHTHIIHLRHNTRQVEDLGRQVSHVAVYENKKWLDDACVGSEPGGEGG